MDTPPPKRIEAVIRRIIRTYQPDQIVVFGSFARGDQHDDSDVDLLIVKEGVEERFFDRVEAVLACCSGDIAVEPLVYTPTELRRMVEEGNDFITTALSEGIVVYDKQESGRSETMV
jgi:predicted nucleotidyltransferase